MPSVPKSKPVVSRRGGRRKKTKRKIKQKELKKDTKKENNLISTCSIIITFPTIK